MSFVIIIIITIIIIIIEYLSRIDPSAKVGINGCPGLSQNVNYRRRLNLNLHKYKS